jgi:hypothetical protein
MNFELGWKTALGGDERGFAACYLSLGAAYGINQGNVAGRSLRPEKPIKCLTDNLLFIFRLPQTRKAVPNRR